MRILFVILMLLINSDFAYAKVQYRFKSIVEKGCEETLNFEDLILEQNLIPDSCKGLTNETEMRAFVQGQTDIGRHQLVELARSWVKQCQIVTSEKIELIFPESISMNKINFSDTAAMTRRVRGLLSTQHAGAEIQIVKVSVPKINCDELKNMAFETTSLDGRGGFSIAINLNSESKWITGQYRVFRNVPVATRALNLGEKVQSDDFEIKRVDVTQVKERILSADDIVGRISTKSLSPGSVYTNGNLKLEPAVLRGQVVKIIVADEMFEITANGVAEENGHIGDQIKVKTFDSRKTVSGVITERGQVQIK